MTEKLHAVRTPAEGLANHPKVKVIRVLPLRTPTFEELLSRCKQKRLGFIAELDDVDPAEFTPHLGIDLGYLPNEVRVAAYNLGRPATIADAIAFREQKTLQKKFKTNESLPIFYPGSLEYLIMAFSAYPEFFSLKTVIDPDSVIRLKSGEEAVLTIRSFSENCRLRYCLKPDLTSRVFEPEDIWFTSLTSPDPRRRIRNAPATT